MFKSNLFKGLSQDLEFSSRPSRRGYTLFVHRREIDRNKLLAEISLDEYTRVREEIFNPSIPPLDRKLIRQAITNLKGWFVLHQLTKLEFEAWPTPLDEEMKMDLDLLEGVESLHCVLIKGRFCDIEYGYHLHVVYPHKKFLPLCECSNTADNHRLSAIMFAKLHDEVLHSLFEVDTLLAWLPLETIE